jgi:hypothetical protein
VPVRYRAVVLLATFADLRWGELAGLRRENIDLDACEIRIVETLAELDKGGLLPETPKSRAGKRTVAFPAELVPELRWHLERFAEPASAEWSSSVPRAGGCAVELPEDLEQGPCVGRAPGSAFSRSPTYRRYALGPGCEPSGANGAYGSHQREGRTDLSARHPRASRGHRGGHGQAAQAGPAQEGGGANGHATGTDPQASILTKIDN